LKLPRLREVRELHGWSQSRLAEEAGVSRDSISNYETGHREAYPSTAKKLADALGVTIADFMEEVVLPKVAPTTPLLEWALTASDEDFDRRIETATGPEVTELLQLNRLVPQRPGPHRDRVLERVSKIVGRLEELEGYWVIREDISQSDQPKLEGQETA
jgi:transcriptional regulator with XRE-family HTH domain